MFKKCITVPVSIVMLASMFMLMFDVSSFAQPAWGSKSAEEMPQAFMDAEDANGDGKVTMDEFKGPDDEFNVFDKNGDGVIELAEAPTPDTLPEGIGEAPEALEPYTVTINGVNFEATQPMYDWDELPDNVVYEREPLQSFTLPNGETRYYEVIYVSSMNLDWYQTAYLAQEAGGYMACITSEEENEFVFNLVSDEKYFWAFPEDGGHYGIKIGPNLGGYQPEGSPEPDGGWSWLSGEPWEYSNWAKNLDDGVIDKDPRDNTQPNDSADGQPVMGFGELNLPVSTWGDYTASPTTPMGAVRGHYAFIIEYESHPEK